MFTMINRITDRASRLAMAVAEIAIALMMLRRGIRDLDLRNHGIVGVRTAL